MDMDKLRKSNSAIGNKEPTAKNLTTSLGARDPLMGIGVHATSIDMTSFWNDYKDLVDDSRLWNMTKKIYWDKGVDEAEG